MILEDRVSAFQKLGDFFLNFKKESAFKSIFQEACDNNTWFTQPNIEYALFALGQMLRSDSLRTFLDSYPANNSVKKIGVVVPANIPLVGFYDFLYVLLSGNIFIGKLSKSNNILLPFIANQLCNFNPEFKKSILFKDLLTDIDLLIVTGDDNTAQYFDYTYSHLNKIIRRNRVSFGVINGLENDSAYRRLSNDVYRYFGLGCRSVSKLFIPRTFDLSRLIKPFHDCEFMPNLDYLDNYNYQKSLCQMRDIDFLDFTTLLLVESSEIGAPISVLYYEYYDKIKDVNILLEKYGNKTQCIVSEDTRIQSSIFFGHAQKPTLCDFPDDIDVMNFIYSN